MVLKARMVRMMVMMMMGMTIVLMLIFNPKPLKAQNPEVSPSFLCPGADNHLRRFGGSLREGGGGGDVAGFRAVSPESEHESFSTGSMSYSYCDRNVAACLSAALRLVHVPMPFYACLDCLNGQVSDLTFRMSFTRQSPSHPAIERTGLGFSV